MGNIGKNNFFSEQQSAVTLSLLRPIHFKKIPVIKA